MTVAAYKLFTKATSREMPQPPSFNPGWGKDDHPIVGINWDDASAFCDWAGSRLPTEAAWESAARGGHEGRKYPWGTAISEREAEYNSRGGTVPVASYPANDFGLYDMAGNVWEWCADWYGEYSGSQQKDPAGPSTGTRRVLRGGSWGFLYPSDLRCSSRFGVVPGEGVLIAVGFRCVREVFP